MTSLLKQELYRKEGKVFLCIGTTKCIGDSLGPMVGEKLSSILEKKDIFIFGNLKQNVNYKNINIVLNTIYSKIKNPYIIVIDSALSHKNFIGNIIINKNNMVIGSALNKNYTIIGNLSIKGIVGENNKNNIKNYNILNNISKDVIEKLSNNISTQILRAL